MSPLAALRLVSRSTPARLVAGMRVSMVSSVARPMTRMTLARAAGARAFSATSGRLGSGATDNSLTAKLTEELTYEKDAFIEGEGAAPEFIKSFLEQGVWSIEDVRGHDEVALSRKFADENIRVMFSIADIAPEEEYEMENENEDEELPAPAIRVSLSVAKNNGPGALNFDLICENGQIAIENISFYDTAKLGTELTAEADWNRRGLYIGPQFVTLDNGLQDEFERFLQERGINESLAAFIPEYAAFKEQHEYIKWLAKVKKFVEL